MLAWASTLANCPTVSIASAPAVVTQVLLYSLFQFTVREKRFPLSVARSAPARTPQGMLGMPAAFSFSTDGALVVVLVANFST